MNANVEFEDLWMKLKQRDAISDVFKPFGHLMFQAGYLVAQIHYDLQAVETSSSTQKTGTEPATSKNSDSCPVPVAESPLYDSIFGKPAV